MITGWALTLDAAQSKEKKGLDIVRRDWCKLAKRAGDRILDFILSGESVDTVVNNIHQFLRDLAADMANDKITVSCAAPSGMGHRQCA